MPIGERRTVMKLPRRRFLHLAAGAAALAFAPHVARAQAYPSRPVKVIVPYPPAGGADTVSRILFQKLSEMWGTQFVIDNRGGAGGTIGEAGGAKIRPDGDNAVLHATPLLGEPKPHPQLAFDFRQEFCSG